MNTVQSQKNATSSCGTRVGCQLADSKPPNKILRGARGDKRYEFSGQGLLQKAEKHIILCANCSFINLLPSPPASTSPLPPPLSPSTCCCPYSFPCESFRAPRKQIIIRASPRQTTKQRRTRIGVVAFVNLPESWIILYIPRKICIPCAPKYVPDHRHLYAPI